MIKYLLVLGLLAFSACNLRPRVLSDFQNLGEYADADTMPTIDIVGTPKIIVAPKFDIEVPTSCALDDIFEEISIVKLETNDNCIVGNCNSIYIFNDTIYILDAWKSKTVFLFDMTGKFITKVGKIGNGTGEYTEPTTLSVNEHSLSIYDQYTHKIVIFDHNGNFMREVVFPFACTHVSTLDNGDYLCYTNDADNFHYPSFMNYWFWQCDSSSCTINKVGLYKEHGKFRYSLFHHFYQYNSREYFFDWTTNTYYEISNDGKLDAKVKLKFEPEPEELFYTNEDYYQQLIKEGKGFLVAEFVSWGNYAIYTLGSKNFGQFVFHNLSDNKSINCFSVKPKKSKLSRVLGLYYIKTFYKNNVVYSLPAERILSDYKRISASVSDFWSDAPAYVREFDKKLLESLHEEDNDILVFAKLKEHFD